MTSVEIKFMQVMEQIKVTYNGSILDEVFAATNLSISLPLNESGIVEFEFFPFKIKPLIRIDGFLVDTWLADIAVYDHKVSIPIHQNFYASYRQRDLDGRIAHFTLEEQNSEHFHDKYIGINNLYPEILEEIKELLA